MSVTATARDAKFAPPTPTNWRRKQMVPGSRSGEYLHHLFGGKEEGTAALHSGMLSKTPSNRGRARPIPILIHIQSIETLSAVCLAPVRFIP
jgi:hypothetical protein